MAVVREESRLNKTLGPSNPQDGVALENCKLGWVLELGRHT